MRVELWLSSHCAEHPFSYVHIEWKRQTVHLDVQTVDETLVCTVLDGYNFNLNIADEVKIIASPMGVTLLCYNIEPLYDMVILREDTFFVGVPCGYDQPFLISATNVWHNASLYKVHFNPNTLPYSCLS